MDAGDFTGDPTVPGEKLTDALVYGMNQLGYEVSNLSMRELSHGYRSFSERREQADFVFVSSNIVWQDTGEPVVDPTTILDVELREGAGVRRVKVGFIGLTRHDPAFRVQGPDDRRIVTIDPIGTAQKYVPGLSKRADVVVVLSSLDLANARGLSKKVGGIDLILGGLGRHRTRAEDFPEDTKFGRTRVMYIGDQGKNLGEVRLFFDDRKTIASTQRSLIGLTRDWPDDSELAGLMLKTKREINEWNRAQAIATNPFAVAEAPTGNQSVYTGFARCEPCHQPEFITWTKTGHAHAFDTLVKAEQEYNPKCVGCHTVGYGKAFGFLNAKATPNLVTVGCESCHGPSSRHPDFVLEGYGKTDTDFCLSCHTEDNSPDYDPGIYIPKIRHWEDGADAP